VTTTRRAGTAGPTVTPPTVTLATSNGTGMGHLARQMSVALALTGHADPLIFSLSSAAPIIRTHDLRGEYCPSYQREWMPRDQWHAYLQARVRAFVAETGTRVLVFDGVVPYLGLLRARASLPDTAFVWARRGLWRPGVNEAALRARPFFDLVIEPGDLASDADLGATARLDDAVRIPPITLLEHMTPLPREEAAAALGLDPSRPAALVTVSSGLLHDVMPAGAAALAVLLGDEKWQVAVTRMPVNPTGVPLVDLQRCVELRGVYPLARYLSAFDASVSAAGYNSLHEFLYAGVPTLFVPNPAAATDDQVRRARWAAGKGLALYADESAPDAVAAQAARLLDSGLRAELRAACAELPRPRGGAAAAQIITALADSWAGRPNDLRTRLTSAELAARAAAIRVLGTRGTSVVRRALGRPPTPGPRRPLTVRLVEDRPGEAASSSSAGLPPVLLTERLGPELLGENHPVEHLLPGSSPAYRDERRRIVRRFYDVR